jgi:hypothetical protein
MKRRGQNLSSSLRAVGRLELDLFNNLIRPSAYELAGFCESALLNAGHDVVSAIDGEAALVTARELVPNLIRLDM